VNKLRSRLTSAYNEALTLAKIMLERLLKEKTLDKILAQEQHIKLHGYMDPLRRGRGALRRGERGRHRPPPQPPPPPPPRRKAAALPPTAYRRPSLH